MINREGEAKQKIKDAYRYLEESPTGLVRWVENKQCYIPVGSKRIRRGVPES